ncbi:MAG: PilZ domain-containing protein [Acidobacteria bacterium]|nr:PilZ domain-containing protein [Acidobacteriota bacterium]
MCERKSFRQSIEFGISVLGAGDYATFRGESLDISPDGLGLLSEYPLVQGMVVRLTLPVDGVGIPVPVFAEVSRVIPVGNRFRAGLRFFK